MLSEPRVVGGPRKQLKLVNKNQLSYLIVQVNRVQKINKRSLVIPAPPMTIIFLTKERRQYH